MPPYTNPPCKQLLAVVVMGAGVLIIRPPLLLSFASLSSPVLVVLPPSLFTCPHCHDDRAISAHDPSCKQWLAVRGQVLGYPGVMLMVIAITILLSLDLGDMAISTHYPPCKQWLTAVGVDALLVLLCCCCC